MAEDSPSRPLLIVTGSTLRAEELDRPLAYYLKQKVERASAGLDVAFRVVVVADFRWMNDEGLQVLPTLSVGGPGVNALAQAWFEEIPFSMAVDDQFYIQMDPDLAEPPTVDAGPDVDDDLVARWISTPSRASLWGMDNATTQIAVSVFVERYLPRFLDHAAAYTPPDPVESDEADDPDD